MNLVAVQLTTALLPMNLSCDHSLSSATLGAAMSATCRMTTASDAHCVATLLGFYLLRENH